MDIKSIYIAIYRICKRVLLMNLSQKSGENTLKTDHEDMKSGAGESFSTRCCFFEFSPNYHDIVVVR